MDWDKILGEGIFYASFKSEEEIIDLLSKYIDNIQDKHFYILGGSQLNLYIEGKTTSKNDIDIFFENEEEFKKLSDSIAVGSFNESVFAKSYEFEDVAVQLVYFKYGTVKDHFNRFDLNMSRIGFEYNKGKIIKHIDKSFHDVLSINYKNFNKDTARRYLKYYKRIYGDNQKYNYNSTIIKIIHYLWDNSDTEIHGFYDNENNKTGIWILIDLNRLLLTELCIDATIDIMNDEPIIKRVQFWNWTDDILINARSALQKDVILASSENLKHSASDEFKKKYPQLFI